MRVRMNRNVVQEPNMTPGDAMADLFGHMEWADADVWCAVVRSPAALTDTRLLGLLHHLHLVQRAFLRIWRGEPRESPYPTFGDARDLMGWARAYYPEARAELGSRSGPAAAKILAVPWAGMVEKRLGRPPGATTFGETALHVALHSQYHRGQVNARLREVGGEPPLVDYIAWLWLGRPRAEWPNAI
jgi:uncharacterized damage-inducible protein DinB